MRQWCTELTAAEVVTWLDDVYPRTPVVLYTGEPDLSGIERTCAARGLAIQPASPSPEGWEAGTEVIRPFLLGLIGMSGGVAPIFAREGLRPEVVQCLETRIFAPWEERRLHVRRWLIDMALPEVGRVGESLLRTVETFFDTVPREELACARGVEETTIVAVLKEVPRTWGMPLASLMQRWERAFLKRGAVSAHQFPWQPTSPSRPVRSSRRPSARRRS